MCLYPFAIQGSFWHALGRVRQFLDRFYSAHKYSLTIRSGFGSRPSCERCRPNQSGSDWSAVAVNRERPVPVKSRDRSGQTLRPRFHKLIQPGNNQVKCTLEDSSGRFWVIDGDDLEEFDRKSEKVLLRFRSLGMKMTLRSKRITAVSSGSPTSVKTEASAPSSIEAKIASYLICFMTRSLAKEYMVGSGQCSKTRTTHSGLLARAPDC